MYLTLEVVSPQAASLGVDRRRVVGERGLTIGRGASNDWVFPDPYISKEHARIRFSGGGFFIESLGRNAIAIGSPSNTLPGNRPQPLRSGDRLFIDQYEVIVTTQEGVPPGLSVPSDDPFAVLPATPGSPSSKAGTIPDVWNGGPGNELVDTGVIDPLSLLPGGREAPPPPLPSASWQHSSALEDHFEPPPVQPSAGGSPFDLLEPPGESQASPAMPAVPSSIPDNWDFTNLNMRPLAPPAGPAGPSRNSRGSREPAPPRPVRPEPVKLDAPDRSRLPDSRAQIPTPEPPPAAADSRRLRAPAIVETRGADSDLTALLRGAGLADSDMSPEVMQELGKVLRVVVEGLMEVLRARAEIKAQFRVPLTRMKSVENNPLKHSPNVESALHTLLVQRNPGFLSSVQAFEDAFADIRNHQMAMLEGVRVAFESMLESFDPKELEKEFDRNGKRGFGSAKSRYWELYVNRFGRLGEDADDTYRKLFGDVFASTYEKQFECLKALGNKSGKP